MGEISVLIFHLDKNMIFYRLFSVRAGTCKKSKIFASPKTFSVINNFARTSRRNIVQALPGSSRKFKKSDRQIKIDSNRQTLLKNTIKGPAPFHFLLFRRLPVPQITQPKITPIVSTIKSIRARWIVTVQKRNTMDTAAVF